MAYDVTAGGAARLQRDLSVPGEPVVVDTYTTAEWTGCVRGLSGNMKTAKLCLHEGAVTIPAAKVSFGEGTVIG